MDDLGGIVLAWCWLLLGIWAVDKMKERTKKYGTTGSWPLFFYALKRIAILWVLIIVGAGFAGFICGHISRAYGQTINHTFRDASGRSMGRSSTDTRGNTTFYNEKGQTTGRSSTQNGTTTIYNPLGQQTGTIRSNR